jgi:hypothetical protein
MKHIFTGFGFIGAFALLLLAAGCTMYKIAGELTPFVLPRRSRFGMGICRKRKASAKRRCRIVPWKR